MALMVPKHRKDNEPFLSCRLPPHTSLCPLWARHQCIPFAGRK